MNKLLLLALTCAATLPAAQAQTGRLAHLSHGGSPAALAETADNLGLPEYTAWKADTLVYLNDSTVLHKGLYSTSHHGPPTSGSGWYRQVRHISFPRVYYRQQSWSERLEELRRLFPEATRVGFDKAPKPAPKKPSSRTPSFQKRPFQYSYWRGLATVAALGAVGWLLGKKRLV